MNDYHPSETDRIERSILINAPRERVWQALTNAEQFGAWFGADLSGQVFAPGQRACGPNTSCGHEDKFFDAVIERIEPQQLLSFHWHPFASDAAFDFAGEPPTLVVFRLQDAPGNAILLSVVESGFDRLPAPRRTESFPLHTGGWEQQLKNVAKHVAS